MKVNTFMNPEIHFHELIFKYLYRKRLNTESSLNRKVLFVYLLKNDDIACMFLCFIFTIEKV